MTDNEFTPQTVVIDPGTVVRWVNVGRNKHNVVVDVKSPAWTSSKSIKAGKDYDHQFDEPGVYGYSCSFHGAAHQQMYGTVIVRNADGTVPGRGHRRQAPKPHADGRPHDPRPQGPEDDPVGGRPRRARRPDPVSPGVYHEAVSVTTDDLVIRGTDRNRVILDGAVQARQRRQGARGRTAWPSRT